MLEIIIEPRRVFNLKQAVTEAIESGDYDTLFEDIRDCFTEEQIELIEEVLDSGDIGESIDEIVNEWGGDDVDELLETIENFFADSSIEVRFADDEEFAEEEATEEFDDYDENYEETADESFDEESEGEDEEEDESEEEEESDDDDDF